MKVLTAAEAASFVERGYVVVRNAFARETAAALLPHIWARLDEEPRDPATWRRAGTQIEDIIRQGPVADLFTPRFDAAIDDLVGEGRWWTRRDGFGWVVLRFPGHATAPWRAPASGWHVDGIHFHHHLRSPEQGLVGLELFTDVEPGGGGTAVRVGSHLAVARLLAAAEPHGIAYAELRDRVAALGQLPLDQFSVEELTGQAGDMIWLHPLTVHARSPNTRATVRIAANRCVGLHAPLDLARARDEDHSLVEEAVRLALR